MADTKTKIILTAANETNAAFNAVGRNLDSMAGSLFNINGLLASVSAVSLVAMVKSSIDAADEMSKAAQKVGITTEALSRLKYAAELSDVPFESLEKSMTKLSRAAYDATTTGGASALAFTQMGVSVTDASGKLKDSGVLMSEIAAKFAVMEDGSAKTALAMSVFGKSGADMIPLLNSGSDGLARAADEADRLGIVISGNTGPESERFNDNLTRMQKAGTGAANQITEALLPALNVVAEAFVGGAKDGAVLAAVTATIKTAFEAIVILGSDVAFVFKTIGNEIGGAAAAMAALATGDFAGFSHIRAAMKEDALASRKELDEFQASILNPPAAAALPARTGAAPVIENEAANRKLAAADKENQALVDRYIKWDEAEFARQEKQTFDLVNKQQERFVALRQSAEDAEATDLERVQLKQDRELEQLELQREILATDHELTLAELETFEQAKADIITRHSDNIRVATLNSDKKIVDGKVQYQKMSLDSMGAFFGMAKGLMNTHSRAAFEIGKAAAIGETVINTYKSATAAYSAMAGIPIVGPALGIAAAAAAVLSGMAQVSAIQSTGFGGSGGGGGSYGGASSATSGGVATPNYPMAPVPEAPKSGVIISVNLGDDPGMPGAQWIRNFAELLNEQIRDGVIIDQIRVA